MKDADLLFVNIGWMTDYAGIADNDPISGGHGHFKDHDFGHEAWNFAPYRGRFYGYIPSAKKVSLKRLGAPTSATTATGVTVVWVARHPSTKNTYIVGWYRNATVATELRYIVRGRDYDVEYRIEAPVHGHKLLLPDQRSFRIPTSKERGHLGQSPIWYGGSDEFKAKVREYLGSGGATKAVKGTPRSNDPEARKRVELAAIRHATRYYESKEGGSRHVDSVEADAAGWDLTVTGPGSEVLKVEVKGCSGDECIAELTPNEYEKMRSRDHRMDYVVYIVTRAGTDREAAHIFRFVAAESKGNSLVWRTQGGRILKVAERLGASISSI